MMHLNCHSVYSYKESIMDVADIAKASKEAGNDAFCITDINSCTAFIKASFQAGKMGLKFIHGMELSVKPDAEHRTGYIQERIKHLAKGMNLKRTTDDQRVAMQGEMDQLQSKLDRNLSVEDHRVILLARNEAGLSNLIHLYNIADNTDTPDVYCVQRESVFEHSEGLVCILNRLSDVAFALELERCKEAKAGGAESLLVQWKGAYGEWLFAGLEIDSSKEWIDLMQRCKVDFVAVNDARYVKPVSDDGEDNYRLYYRLFRNAMSPVRITGFRDHTHMLTDQEFMDLAEGHVKPLVEGAVKQAKRISDQCEDIKFPEADKLLPFDDQLRDLVVRGWERKRKGTPREQESWERLNYELDVIKMKNFSQYFLKVLSIVEVADQLGVMHGPARGSGGGSEICYLLGITDLDPLEYGLFFERFLNPGRPGYPDIDIDFSAVPNPADAQINVYERCDA